MNIFAHLDSASHIGMIVCNASKGYLDMGATFTQVHMSRRGEVNENKWHLELAVDILNQ